MDRVQLESWLDDYERAWRADGTGLLGDLFAEEATYSTGPYEKPHRGLRAIAEMWEAERSAGEEFRIEREVIAVDGNTGVVHVEVNYERPRRQQYRDLWVVRLDEAGLCVQFEEWPFWPPGSGGAVAPGASG